MPDKAYKPLGKVKKYPYIVNSFTEVLREEGTFKSFENGASGSATTQVYIVPQGYVFYIVSAQLFYRTETTPSSASAYLTVNTFPLLYLDPPDVANQVLVAVSNPAIPIKLYAGQKVNVVSDDTKLFVRGTISGYEIKIDKRLKFMR